MSRTFKEISLSIYQAFTLAIDDKLNCEISVRESIMLDNFEKRLSKKHYIQSLGVSFLYNYFSFQFDYWIEKDTRANNRRLPLGWLVGEKAILRWESRREVDLYHCLKTARRLGISMSQFYEVVKIDYNAVREDEELVKNQLLNTERGFALCLTRTTLYNKQSQFCQGCVFSQSCKSALKELFPKIYINRGYAQYGIETNKRIKKSERTQTRLFLS